ncbi:MAG: amino acid ABC transporter substrate-binding protein [Alphaproteobacteria bacterium]|nr:MAG: amino acid ABC transporter substrate-binding protein [Alphaproteobacteria bacterium]
MTQTTKTILLSILCSVAVTLLLAQWLGWGGAARNPVASEKTNSVVAESSSLIGGVTGLERVQQTKTLRCGYIVLPPEFNKDPNTGKFAGFSYDATEEAARRLGWKVDWKEEVNFATMSEGFKTNRYDALCFSLYRYSPMAAIFDYSIPLFYTGTYIYARANDSRFDNNIAAINNENITIATIDGEMSQFIARDDFSKAKVYSMPQGTDLTQMMLAVETGKADITFNNTAAAQPYILANPGKIHNVAPNSPIRLFSHGFAFKKGDAALVSTMNTVFEEMINDGTIDKILTAHEKIPGTFLRPAKPYQASKMQNN